MITGKFFRNDRGFTLLEVLLSITILSIVIISFLAFFNQAYSYTKQNEDKTVGINVARNVLYYMEQQDYTKVNTAYFDQLTDLAKLDPDKATKEGIEIKCDKSIIFDSPEDKDTCEALFLDTKINSTKFNFTVMIMLPKDTQLKGFLFPIKVTAEWNDKRASVEGVIKK